MRYAYRILINIEPSNEQPGIPAKWSPERWSKNALGGYRDGDRLVQTYVGQIEATDPLAAAWAVVERHNRDDRPDGQLGPSFSPGDIVEVSAGEGQAPRAWAGTGIELEEVDAPGNVETERSWTECARELQARGRTEG